MKKKYILVLLIIYVSFIALGLPDALLGSAWNLVRVDLNVPLASLGLITVLFYALTLFVTINAPRILRLIQTKTLVFISIFASASALLLISQITAFWQLFLLAIPLGMGAGAIDLSLNHYVSLHYKASHMNYLHSFYGVGVTFGPLVMAFTLQDNSWRMGYIIVGLVLLLIATIVFLSFPSWDEETEEHRVEHHTHIPLKEILKTKGVKTSLVIFMMYVHVETLAGIFVASYFFLVKQITYSEAALFTMTYFLALTISRFISGVLSHKLSPQALIYIGEILIILSMILIYIPSNNLVYYYIVIALLGLGSGPVFPNMMYLNPHIFDKNKTSRIMSLQMAVGYLGSGVLTPIGGLLFQEISIHLYPVLSLIGGTILLLLTINFLRLRVSKS